MGDRKGRMGRARKALVVVLLFLEIILAATCTLIEWTVEVLLGE